jgi:hypothetical protein
VKSNAIDHAREREPRRLGRRAEPQLDTARARHEVDRDRRAHEDAAAQLHACLGRGAGLADQQARDFGPWRDRANGDLRAGDGSCWTGRDTSGAVPAPGPDGEPAASRAAFLVPEAAHVASNTVQMRYDSRNHRSDGPSNSWSDRTLAVINCQQLIEFCLDYVEGALPADEQERFRRHLSLCPDCVTFFETYQKTPEVSRDALKAQMPESVRESVRSYLRTLRNS